ncbi:hypothetical protein DMB44_03810 [Thermoplasma sp. Kam2015]|nr:hypothetical protein DMB44_03810 [Thermoplasma sp. Kam2015]
MGKNGKLLNDTLVFTGYHIINDSVQRSLVLIDTYTTGSISYIFNPDNNTIGLAYVMSEVDNMYVRFNFSIGQAYEIYSGEFLYQYTPSNPNYGTYLVSSGFQHRQLFYEELPFTSVTISWEQMPTNLICYEDISITPGGDYVQLLTGPYNIPQNSYYSYNAFSIQVE